MPNNHDDFQIGNQVEASLMVGKLERRTSVKKTDFLIGKLYDRYATYDTCIWDTRAINMNPKLGDVFHATYDCREFNGNLQLDIVREKPIKLSTRESVTDLSPYVRTSELTRDDFMKFYNEQCRPLIEDKSIEQLLDLLLNGKKFWRAPAASGHHHSWIGGLAEHCYSLLTLFIGGLQTYKTFQTCRKGLVIAGLIGHDYCKVFDYEEGAPGKFNYTRYGSLVSHLPGGPIMIAKLMVKNGITMHPELEMHLNHILLSHHGYKEFSSPVEPCTVEAWIVHSLDILDGKTAELLSMKDGEYKRNTGNAFHLRVDEIELKASQ